MVYCNKKENTVYYFGTNTEDITGIVRFYTDGTAPTIEQQPVGGEAAISEMMKLNAKYREKFAQNIFPDRISYER